MPNEAQQEEVKQTKQQKKIASVYNDVISVARQHSPSAFKSDESKEMLAAAIGGARAAVTTTWQEDLVRDTKTAATTLVLFSVTGVAIGYLASRKGRSASSNEGGEQISNENPFATPGVESSFKPMKAAK